MPYVWLYTKTHQCRPFPWVRQMLPSYDTKMMAKESLTDYISLSSMASPLLFQIIQLDLMAQLLWMGEAVSLSSIMSAEVTVLSTRKKTPISTPWVPSSLAG